MIFSSPLGSRGVAKIVQKTMTIPTRTTAGSMFSFTDDELSDTPQLYLSTNLNHSMHRERRVRLPRLMESDVMMPWLNVTS